MQQEDDLRGLAKTMDFMRALSILFVVISTGSVTGRYGNGESISAWSIGFC